MIKFVILIPFQSFCSIDCYKQSQPRVLSCRFCVHVKLLDSVRWVWHGLLFTVQLQLFLLLETNVWRAMIKVEQETKKKGVDKEDFKGSVQLPKQLPFAVHITCSEAHCPLACTATQTTGACDEWLCYVTWSDFHIHTLLV